MIAQYTEIKYRTGVQAEAYHTPDTKAKYKYLLHTDMPYYQLRDNVYYMHRTS